MPNIVIRMFRGGAIMGRSIILGVCLAAGLSASASAQDAQTYFYDGNGRLVASTLAQPTTGVMTAYALDAADNRMGRNAAAAAPPPNVDRISFPYTLLPTQKLTSLNGVYNLTFEPGGDLVISSSSGVLWNSCTGQGRSVYLRMLSDGDLVLHGTDYLPIWSTGTAGNPGAELTLQNDGVAVIRDAANVVVWSSTTPCA